VIDDGVVLVEGNRIAAVGPHGSVEIPKDAKVIDVAGKTIVPGLVDVHAHGSQGENGFIPQDNWLHYATLSFGVTTVHDPSNDTATIFTAAEMARAGTITAPRIFSTGTILYGARAPFKAVIDSLDDARSHLRRMKAVGAISVKSYNQPRRDQRQQVVAAARELQMMVVPEGGSLFMHNMTMVVDGHTGVEHAIPIARGYDDVEQLWGSTSVGYTPTTGVGYGGLWGENYWYAHTNVFEHERLRTFVPPARIDSRARRRLLASKGDWNHFEVAELTHQLAQAGVSVNLGAHGQREGLAAHWELWMFVQGGMTPHEALRAGTLNGARYLGLDRDIGSSEPGKLADLAVIDGDPLADIRVSENVAYTMVNGRLFDAQTMNEIAPKARIRPQLAWERDGAWSRAQGGTEAHVHGCSCGAG
jgi:imidazolonepropionase-like amidohydrolase